MWTSLSQEASLIAALEASPRVAVEILGESVQGRPIRLLRIGNPAPGPADRVTLLLTGCVHGNEPAGREALLALAQQLDTTDDAGDLAWLADNPVWLIPTVNPDGIDAGMRENADGVDLNRDLVALTAPETQAVARALGRGRPLVMVDMHESINLIDPTSDIEVNCARPAQAHQNIKDRGVELRDLMLARATSEGWPNDIFGSTVRGDLTLLDINAALRHSVACIVETNFSDDTTSGREHRLEMQNAMVEEIWDWTTGNTSGIASDVAEAIADKIAEGEAGTEPFDLRSGGTLDPPPLGYRLSGVLPAFHLDVYNIQVGSGLVVSMAQSAQPIIPYLFDPDSGHTIASGTRLFDLTPPVSVATVSEFADVVSGSHKVVVEARVLASFQSGSDPDGTEIPVIAGDVTFDATAEVWSELQLETIGVDQDTGESWFPRFPDSLLAPYGNEIFVRRGVDTGGGGILWSLLGYFRIDSVEQTGETSEAPLRITGQDRMGAIIEATLLAPREYAATDTFGAVFADLVGDVHPDASIVFDDSSAFQAIGRRLVVDESRYEPLLEMADSLGKVMYWDGEGVLRVEDPPDDDEPVWRVAAGRGGVMISAARRVTRDGAFNAVIVQGEGGGGDDPVRGVAVDKGPKSPTRFGGRFGRVPRVETLPQVTTQAQATAAARQILRRNIGAPFSADFSAVPNPALRPRMPVLVVQRDGNRELHVIETLTIPLTADGAMQATTRERTHIVIGSEVV